MTALVVVQARMSSTRLPGKVLADVDGEPMLALLLRRLSGVRRASGIVVATSDAPDDAQIADAAARCGVRVHRGSLDDVLGRFAGAIGDHAGPVVRVTADCPLIDPDVVDAAVELFGATEGCAYASNVTVRTYPDGLDVEVVDADALRAVAAETRDPAAREHVTIAVREDPARFPAADLVHPEDLGDLRWTVDTAEDLAFVRTVVRRLGPRRAQAGLEEILQAVRRAPSLVARDGVRG